MRSMSKSEIDLVIIGLTFTQLVQVLINLAMALMWPHSEILVYLKDHWCTYMLLGLNTVVQAVAGVNMC